MENRNHEQLTSLKNAVNHQNQHGKRMTAKAEDLVKYMSNLPYYLQQTERADDIQGRALNFGVLNWGSLERWNYDQKNATIGRTEVHSPSSSNSSLSSLSTFGSSTVSGRSDNDIWHFTQKKKFPSSHFDLHLSTEDGHSHVSDEKHCLPNIAFNDLRTAPVKVSNCKHSPGSELKEVEIKERDSKLSMHHTSQAPELAPICSNSVLHEKEKLKAPEHASLVTGDKRITEASRRRFSGDYSLQFATSSPSVPFSCPLPHMSESDEPSEVKTGSPVNVHRTEIPSRIQPKVDSSHRETRNACSRAKLNPLRRLLDPIRKHKATNHIHCDGLDKSDCTHEPPLHGVPTSTCGTQNSSKSRSSDPISHPVKRSLDSFSSSSFNYHESIQDDTCTASSMHALLQLVYKNGQKLLTFTYNDTEILAATMKKFHLTGMDGFTCIYTFYSISVVESKSGVGMSGRSDRKEQDYSSNIVGQMKVTCCQKPTANESNDFVMVREFVLSSAAPTQAKGGPSDFPSNCELGAIVVEIPKEQVNSCGDDCKGDDSGNFADVRSNGCLSLDNNNNCYPAEDLQTRCGVKNQSLPRIITILPSRVHGLPGADALPTPLIDRWKSGGSCDCGGWDIGCTLTILANWKKPNRSSSSGQAHCAAYNESNEINLYIQGGSEENKLAFSLVAYKEGHYMVDFNASISLLQAFSICTAILHDQMPVNHSRVGNFLEAKISSTEPMSTAGKPSKHTRTHGGTPSSYVPYPPLSPVGRV